MIKVNELLGTMKGVEELEKVILILGGECIPYKVHVEDPEPGWEYATDDLLTLLNEHGRDQVKSWYCPRKYETRYLFIELREENKK